MPSRVRRPQRRTPDWPPWDKSECPNGCGAPVRRVFMPDREELVGMKPCPFSDRRGDIATITMDGRLVGWDHPRGGALKPTDLLWISHNTVCPLIEHPEQLALPTEETT